MNVRPRLSDMLRRQLVKELPPAFQEMPTGGWETFDFVSPSIASGGALSGTVSFPVDSALFEISGAADDGGTDVLGNIDAFTIQCTLPDGTALNAGAPLIGTAFFNRQTGIRYHRKPWIVGANQAITITGVNLSAGAIVVYLGFTVLLLGLATNAQQF